MSPRPRGDDWLEDELRFFKSEGVEVIVSLLEESERQELGLGEEGPLCQSLELQFISYPVSDYSVPSSASATKEIASNLSAFLSEGKSVLIHCRQGIGRSGLLAAAVLTQTGISLAEALALISHARGILVPETDEQKKWLAIHFGAA